MSVGQRMVNAALVLACTTAMAGPAEEAKTAFSEFFTEFTPRNQKEVAAMFAPDAQFYGTTTTELVTSAEGVLGYFTAALDNPAPVKAQPLTLTATALTDSVVLLAGTWVAERYVGGQMVSSGPLRLTAVMHKRANGWAVVQFHNSRLPAAPAAAAGGSR